MLSNAILGGFTLTSLGLLLWQWVVARRFPLHRRSAHSFKPPVTLLKPLKGCDATTAECLRSWLSQQYSGKIQVIFGLASGEDPAYSVVKKLLSEFPALDSQIVICEPAAAANGKISKLIQLQKLAQHETIVISDADVRVPEDFLSIVVAPLSDDAVGMVTSFYRLANPNTLAMGWEAVAINVDFWSHVLQAKSLGPMDFALGAVMVTRRKQIAEIGGFETLADCLADDYQLGNRVSKRGYRVELSPAVVECWSKPMVWADVWKHQLRWARTIRVCRPLPYFLSILSNATIWPVLWLVLSPSILSLISCGICLTTRTTMAINLESGIAFKPPGETASTAGHLPFRFGLLAPLKDFMQTGIWIAAFLGDRIEWAGQKFRLRSDGRLEPATR